MALVLAAGLGAAQLIRWLSASRRLPPAAGAIAVVVLLALLAQPGRTLTLWPRPGEWPTYASIERGFRLPALWATLGAGPEGRVLIARSGLPLVHGSAWYRPHSHVTALTPLRAGRPIVHGTFTHPSPVAAFVYRGDAGGGAITMLAEQLDGVALFGRPYARPRSRDLRRRSPTASGSPSVRGLRRGSGGPRRHGGDGRLLAAGLVSALPRVHAARAPGDSPRDGARAVAG